MTKRFSIHAFSSILFISVLNSCQNSSNEQMEKLEKNPEPTTSINIPFASANNALAEIASLSQKTAVEDAVLNAKIQQALDAIPRLAQSLELLALAPIRNNIELEHDVVGILPYANQTQRVRSNQVLTWLSM